MSRSLHIMCVIIIDCLAVCAAIFIQPLAALSARISPYCLLRAGLGLRCSLCGGTHSLVSLCKGRVWEAFLLNPFVFLTLVFCVFLLALYHLSVFTNLQGAKILLSKLFHYRVAVVWAVAAGIFLVMRNLAAW